MASLVSLSLPKPNIVKASLSTTTSSPPSIISIPENLNEKFGRKGIKFLELDNVPTVDLTVRNGSSLRLRITDAHVTSYKPRVNWKDNGFDEVLYTVPAGGNTDSPKAKGGVGLVFNEVLEPDSQASFPSISEWTVKDTDSDSFDAVQVELSCSSKIVDMTYVISLYPLSMATAVIVKNKGSKAVSFNNAILSYFRFKTRGGAGIEALRCCSYCSHPPLSSPFQILSPSEAMKTEDPGWFSLGYKPEGEVGKWTQQEDPITILKYKFSRLYAAPLAERSKPFSFTTPSKYDIIDQGRELFFRVIRMGFEDIYVSSPGSLSEKFGKDYFICTGPASMVVPVTVKPGEDWKGAQLIEHDNLY